MTLPAMERVTELSRAELIDVVLALIPLAGEVQRLAEQNLVLQAENRQLRDEVARLKRPPASSQNSSQPSSRDYKGKLKRKKKKKLGPRFGHKRTLRPLVENPDRIVAATVEQCVDCQADLREVAPEKVVRRQITELPPIKPVVIETRQAQVRCLSCRSLNEAVLPAALSGERGFGPNLVALVIYLKQVQHLSYQRVRQMLAEWFGLKLSEGAINDMLRRVGEAALPLAQAIGAQVASSRIIASDETSARVGGHNYWEWVFRSEAGVYYLIHASRGAKVIAEMMGQERAAIWLCDCFGAQLKAPADAFQLCLAHQIRDLNRLLEIRPRDQWAADAQALLRQAIHLWHRLEQLTIDGFVRQAMALEDWLDQLLSRKRGWSEAERLRKRFEKHRYHLLTFLHHPGVSPTNNGSEQALRPSVIHRKVTNGFRSAWGARTYAALATVIATARLHGKEVLSEIAALCGPALTAYLEPAPP